MPDTKDKDVRQEPLTHSGTVVDHGDAGYHQGLTSRQVQMIAIGGAIGVGLFLGAGGRLHTAGPSVVLAYAFCGLIAFFLMRALGELVTHRPSSGSFVSYAREFFGDRWAYITGWMYMLNWMTTGVAELTAVGSYFQFWWPELPLWIPALVALVIVLAVNLASVKAFGEFEFWASMLKVTALVAFLVVGLGLVLTHANVGGHPAAASNLWSFEGGFFPAGALPLVMVTQGVVFAYATIELVGTASGETENPHVVIPKAVKAVIFRIVIFYVGSILLLAMLLPYTAYKASESPFVTVFSQLRIPWIGDAMNVVVITAAFSSCNSGLYSTGRVLKSLAAAGEAPSFTGRLNANKVPFGGILLTATVYLLGIGLAIVLPHQAFEIAVETAAVGIVWTWVTIFACQIALRRRINRGEAEPTSFPMPGAPVTSIFGIVSLIGIIVLMAFNDFNRVVLAASLLYIGAVLIGWTFVKRHKARHPELSRAQEIDFG